MVPAEAIQPTLLPLRRHDKGKELPSCSLLTNHSHSIASAHPMRFLSPPFSLLGALPSRLGWNEALQSASGAPGLHFTIPLQLPLHVLPAIPALWQWSNRLSSRPEVSPVQPPEAPRCRPLLSLLMKIPPNKQTVPAYLITAALVCPRPGTIPSHLSAATAYAIPCRFAPQMQCRVSVGQPANDDRCHSACRLTERSQLRAAHSHLSASLGFQEDVPLLDALTTYSPTAEHAQ